MLSALSEILWFSGPHGEVIKIGSIPMPEAMQTTGVCMFNSIERVLTNGNYSLRMRMASAMGT